MWENLPVPKAENVGGVAFIGPKAIMTFVMACGVPVDDILIMGPGADLSNASGPTPTKGTVLNVEDCQRARDWLAEITANHYRKNGAPNDRKAIGVALVDWKDGFCYNRVQGNRGSIDVKTLNVGAVLDMFFFFKKGSHSKEVK